MDTATIEHVSDYIRIIEKINAGYNSSLSILYRGENRTDYKLLPSIYREAKLNNVTTPLYLTIGKEKSIIQSFIREAAGYIRTLQPNERFVWLEYAQHFGVPTRLMDWTSNPLVALYFACQSTSDNTDGKVYIFHQNMYHQITAPHNRDHIDQTIKNTAEKMIWGEYEGFPYPILFTPYYIDSRMSAQSSHFMIWGNKKQPLDEMLTELEREQKAVTQYRETDAQGIVLCGKKEDTILSHIIIPTSHKQSLLHELHRLGINHASLFPGLEGIGKSIEWRYSIKNTEPLDSFF